MNLVRVFGTQDALLRGVREFVKRATAAASRRLYPGKAEAWRVDRDVMARTLNNGQILLPGIAEPHRWDFDSKGWGNENVGEED